MAPPENDTSAVTKCKLSQFTPECPDLWFVIAEETMAVAGVTTPAAKRTCCLQSIEPSMLNDVRDIILGQPAAGQDSYMYLKEALINRYTDTQNTKIHKLLSDQMIGDRKPSLYLRHLQHLAGKAISEDALRVVWIKGLPSNLQTVMATLNDSPLSKAAECADAVFETQQLQHISNNSATISTINTGDTGDTLEAVIRRVMATMLEEIKPSSNRRRFRSRSRTRSTSSDRRDQPHQCWYHHKFGAQANKCMQPCTYKADQKPSGNASGSH